jgi:hypothetical protein
MTDSRNSEENKNKEIRLNDIQRKLRLFKFSSYLSWVAHFICTGGQNITNDAGSQKKWGYAVFAFTGSIYLFEALKIHFEKKYDFGMGH